MVVRLNTDNLNGNKDFAAALQRFIEIEREEAIEKEEQKWIGTKQK